MKNFISYPKQQKIAFWSGIFVLLSTVFFITFAMVFQGFFGYEKSTNSYYIKFHEVFGVFVHLLYYTSLTNIFLGVMLLFVAYKPESEKVKIWFFNSVVLITITFFIYWGLISWTQKWNKIHSVISSLVTHCINPVLGFIVLFLMRRQIKVSFKNICSLSLIVVAYFFFAMIVYLGSGSQYDFKNGAIIYSFLHFYRPFFIKTSSVGLIVTLDLLLFVIAFLAPAGLGFAWKAILKIKIK
ncbi:MAGa3780 family membrane protein [Mycoplasmopsis edwardii]|uniref:Uncharacterized protein n=1 Tax=Mycoplasmopsis edwardii TaxID=53558 RepID=A0ACD4PJ39_9BACT|nr:hypothetical protein [Mycoplasmopsis edwardii]WBP84153.1 hypothetical protein Me_995_000106 [Mycoplasmopsis edwardii]